RQHGPRRELLLQQGNGPRHRSASEVTGTRSVARQDAVEHRRGEGVRQARSQRRHRGLGETGAGGAADPGRPAGQAGARQPLFCARKYRSMNQRAEDAFRADIVEVGRRMYARAYVASNDGNISIRLDADTILTTTKSVSQ